MNVALIIVSIVLLLSITANFFFWRTFKRWNKTINELGKTPLIKKTRQERRAFYRNDKKNSTKKS